MPRTTLQAWRRWHDTLDRCPHVADFFQNGPGLAFLHRLVIALHLVCVEVGACGMRLVCLFLHVTGLNRFVAASYGAQQQVNLHVEQAMVTYDHDDETARLASGMPEKDLTVTQDETCPGGFLCLITMDPESNFLILEPLAQARDQTTGDALMAPALAPLKCRVIQSTRDEAPGLLAYGEHDLEAHHSPDLLHGQHELVKAVAGPMATKERAALKAVTEATAQLERLPSDPQSAGDESEKSTVQDAPQRHPCAWSTPSKCSQRPVVSTSVSRSNVHRARRVSGASVTTTILSIWSAGCAAMATASPMISKGTWSRFAPLPSRRRTEPELLGRIDTAKRVVPKMQATIEFVSRYVGQQVAQLNLTPPASFAMHAQLIPSYDLDRVAGTRTVSDGDPLRALAERLRAPLVEPGGVLRALSPAAQHHLHDEAKRLAAVFQRSSANVEGRNGSLALRSHQLRGLDLPRQRACCTAIHNFLLTRPDGTTAAERFFGQKPRSMFAAILDSVELAPPPLNPPRKA